MDGWIKLHRCLLENSTFGNPDLLKVWIWCLLKAYHKEHEQMVGFQKVTVPVGGFVFGRKAAAKELNMDDNKVYRLINALQKLEKLHIKSNNKYSLVTVDNWALYQDGEQQNDINPTTSEQQMNNKRTTNEHKQECKKDKNDKNEKNYEDISSTVPRIDYSAVVNSYHAYCIDLPRVEKLTDGRKKAIRSALKSHGMDDIERAFQKAHTSDFLSGRVSTDRPWQCNLDWILKPANLIKIIEGNYDNKGGGQVGRPEPKYGFDYDKDY